MKKRSAPGTMKFFEELSGVRFTPNHTGKMEGMQSLSTSCMCNPLCKIRMQEPGSICSKCYAAAMHKRYSNLAAMLERNSEALSKWVWYPEELPVINAAFFRLESFGDLINVDHARNYLRLCKRNPWTRFALWTKNPAILARAIDLEGGKPENLNVILSSPYINVPCELSGWPFVDKTFTVWDKAGQKELQAAGGCINCGSKKCIDCLICYTKNDVTAINESLK